MREHNDCNMKNLQVLLGVNKEKAAKFSFLMVVPLILGKMASDIISGEISSSNVDLTSLFFGFISAFITRKSYTI